VLERAKGTAMRHAPARRHLALFAAVAAAGLLLATQLPAAAIPAEPPATGVTANATHFDGLGQPYGGCGMPQAELETQDFVALNVYNTPGVYDFFPRPMPAGDPKIGIWNNGHNCGRWVKVTIGDICTGTNDGAPGQPFCRNGSFVPDAYNGATLNMLVADSCGDSNAWCRDDPYHLDLATPSLNRFLRNGVPVADMNPNHWNNRHLSWSFIPAPNYTGDIQVGFLQGAQRWWTAISVSHLANGIHSVEYLQNGVWQSAPMDGDMGQSFIISGLVAGGTDFQIRVRDVNDALINNGRVYSFSLPASCATQCAPAYTRVTYTTGTAPPSSPPPTSPPPTSPPPTSPPPASSGCAVTASVASSWDTGYIGDFTVTNSGTAPIGGWSVDFGFAGTQRVSNFWSSTVTQAAGSAQVTAGNATFNATLAPGASTSFGMQIDGLNQPLTNLRCTAR
jgi:Cellulose binding domain